MTATSSLLSPAVRRGAAAIAYLLVVTALLATAAGSALDLLRRFGAVDTAQARLAALNGRAASPPTGAATKQSPLLEGQSVTIAGAALQQRVGAAVANVGGALLSSQVDLEGPQAKDGFVELTVDVEVAQLTLQALLYDIEAGMPYFFIEKLAIQAPQAAGKAENSKMRVTRTGVMVFIALGAVASACANEAIGPTAALETGVSRRHDESAAAPFSAAPPPAPGESAPPRGNPLWSIPLRALTETRERPLFSPSRRPLRPIIPAAPEPMQPPPPLAAAPAEPESPPLTLIGTVVGGRLDAGVALLLDATTNVVARARVGESASGWRVRSVAERSIIVEKSGLSVTLALSDPRETAPVAEPRPPSPFAPLQRTR